VGARVTELGTRSVHDSFGRTCFARAVLRSRGVPLVLLLAAAACAAPGRRRATPPSADTAAVLQLRGDHAAARAEAERVLADRPHDADALLVAACAAIEQRDLDAAANSAGGLATLSPHDPRAPVLTSLVGRRRAQPSEPMLASLAGARRAAGRPDLSEASFPGGKELWARAFPAPTADALGTMRSGQRLLLEPRSIGDDRSALAVEVARAPAGEPLVVLLQALSVLRLREGSPPPDPDLVSDLGRAVTAADPDNGLLALAAWLVRAPALAPLTPADAEPLARFAAMPRFEHPAGRLARELVETARSVDPAAASLPARRTDLVLPLTAVNLASRVAATRVASPPPEPDAPLAAALTAIARRLEAAPTHLERLLSTLLAVNAAALGGAGESRTPELTQRLRSARDAAATADAPVQRVALASWPLAFLWREWTPDEIVRLEPLTR